MNTKTHAISTTQVNHNKLRELSYSESTMVSGGLACYKNNSGSNRYRILYVGSGQYAAQTWSSYRKKYVTDNTSPLNGWTFERYCRSVGFNYIKY
jgi:hypothetical protein